MKTIIKLFLVICCDTKTPQGVYHYEVKDLTTPQNFGTIITERTYHEGDTIKITLKTP
jgi:hypothetical protein